MIEKEPKILAFFMTYKEYYLVGRCLSELADGTFLMTDLLRIQFVQTTNGTIGPACVPEAFFASEEIELKKGEYHGYAEFSKVAPPNLQEYYRNYVHDLRLKKTGLINPSPLRSI